MVHMSLLNRKKIRCFIQSSLFIIQIVYSPNLTACHHENVTVKYGMSNSKSFLVWFYTQKIDSDLGKKSYLPFNHLPFIWYASPPEG